jgi:hypothetical protein
MWGFLGRAVEVSPVYAHGAYDWLLTRQHVNFLVLFLMLAATAILPFVAQWEFERKDL